ncbi:MAG: 5-formyltetrahydrofolate cyclo-ligase [Rhodospirillales bacterium]|nr:5-formyltetrahydrofolate cyclo-ligase [Rhodospirillales bacterium]
MSIAETIVETKRRMRAYALETRRVAALDSHDVGDLVAKNFLSGFRDLLANGSQVVSGYWPMRDEIDVRPLLRTLSRQGISCVLPAVIGKGLPLAFRLWQPEDQLAAGTFGTSEPSVDAPELVPTMLLTPLLAFDQSGGRLGYGGGFYDRSLAGLRRRGAVQAVGVGFDAQEVGEAPMAETDQRLDWVVTESRIIQCAG